jgi:SAM-dependent methyltransferase
MGTDTWSSGADYEQYIGRWSRLVARAFLGRLAVSPGRWWLDVGCGTGALTQTILQVAEPSRVTSIDPSADYIVYARASTPDPRVQFLVADALDLPGEAGTYGAVVSGLVLNFVPDLARAVAEMVRVAAGGGAIAAYVWDYGGQMQFLRHFWDAAVALDPAAGKLDEGQRFPLCHPEPLLRLFTDAGVRGVAVHAIDVPTIFRDFEAFWTPFLGGQGPAPSYAMSLDNAHRVALRERLRASMPVAADGTISLMARAWAVFGSR